MKDQFYENINRSTSRSVAAVSGVILTVASVLVLLRVPTARTLEPVEVTHDIVSLPARPTPKNEALADAVLPPRFPSRTAAPAVRYLSAGDRSVPDGWHFECADCARTFHIGTDSLRLDREGHPHLIFASDELFYYWNDGDRWHFDAVNGGFETGSLPALALDDAGRPHISYSSDDGLKYAYLTSSGGMVDVDELVWHVETIDPEGGWYASLALDSSGRPHITYCDGGYGGNLKYTWFDGVSWQREIVGGNEQVYQQSSLVLDRLGRPHVSFKSPSFSSTRYGWRDEAGWHVETVESKFGIWRPLSLALDASDHPHVAYGDFITGHLRYAWYDGAAWNTETVSDDGYVGSLDINPVTGQPHLVYTSDSTVVHAWRDADGWKHQILDDDGGLGALAVSDGGEPHIIYPDRIQMQRLKHVWLAGGAWHEEIVDTRSYGGSQVSLALDVSNLPHIGYAGGAVKYAWLEGGDWHVEVVDDVDDLSDTTFSLDPSGQPQMVYTSSTVEIPMRYAWRDASGWHTEDLWAWGTELSLATDGQGKPHLAYQRLSSDASMAYAWREGEVWHVELVAEYAWFISLAVDEAGQPHIAYLEVTNSSGVLKYAWRDAVGWHAETVDGGEDVGRFASLALDPSGQPAIAYCDYSFHQWGRYRFPRCDLLKFARRDGAAWYIETVDEGGNNAVLALDDEGQPHLMYLVTDGSLKYARHTDTGWHLQTIDGTKDSGWASSVVVDHIGRPHVAFSGYDSRAIKYGWQGFFVDKSASPATRLMASDVLTYTLTFAGPGRTLRLVDPLPNELDFVPGSMVGTLTPTAVYSPSTRAVVWQGTLLSDTVGSIRFQVTPEITSARYLSAPLPITNTVYLTDVSTGGSDRATATVPLQPIPFTVSKQAEPIKGLRGNGIVTYTLTVDGYSRTVRLWDPLPANVSYVAGSVTPPAVYSPTARGVFWSGSVPTVTATVIRFSVTPRITGTGSLSLSQPVVNTVWVTETESGKVISATAIVNGWQLYLPVLDKRSR